MYTHVIENFLHNCLLYDLGNLAHPQALLVEVTCPYILINWIFFNIVIKTYKNASN